MITRFGFRLAAAALLTSGAVTLAQTGPIVIEFGSTMLDFPDNVPISFSVGTISSDLVVKIYDIRTRGSADSPTRSIPAVTISGTIGSGSPRLNVLVADGDESFPTTQFDPMGRGAVDFAGVTIATDSLRNITRAAIAISGDVTGTIDVGHVFRLQALGRGTGTSYLGGRILADVIARAADLDPVTSVSTGHLSSIEFIHAGDVISGKIMAGWNPTLTPPAAAVAGSVGQVRIGVEDNHDGGNPPRPAAVGLTGDIRADKGRVGTLFIAGAVGSSSVTPKIYAGLGINEIRNVEVASTGSAGDLLVRDITADIQASIGFDAEPSFFDEVLYRAEDHAPIYLIETGGAINGTIVAKNVTYHLPRFGERVHSGIIARGPINASINIELNLENADIIGSSINGPVTIGVKAKGAIVASDELNGEIVSVQVGRGLTADANQYDDFFPRGFCGNNGTPWSPAVSAPAATFNADDWYPGGVVYRDSCRDAGCLDSVIRAKSIGVLDLASMTVKFAQRLVNSAEIRKEFAPRIESPAIQTLIIDDLRNGVIWSGRLDAALNSANDPSDDFSAVASLDIDCVAWGGKLWLTGTDDVSISGDFLGELHVPSLDARATVRIGGKLGDWTDTCGCETIGFTCLYPPAPGLDYCPDPNVLWHEGSPRDVAADSTEGVGVIRINEEAGLHGQVIINAKNAPTLATGLWKGHVAVGGKIIGPSPSDADLESPYYPRVSTDLGGGAIGFAPFHLYGTDCLPPHDPVGNIASVDEREINGLTVANPLLSADKTIRVRFYGPLKPKSSWASSVKVRARPFPPGCQGCIGCSDPWLTPVSGLGYCGWIDVTSAFNIYGPGAPGPDGQPWSDPRAIGLKVKNGYYVVPGIYMANPVSATAVRCDHVTDNPPVVWEPVCDDTGEPPQTIFGAMGYGFVVSGDCDEDGIRDQFDCTLTGPGCSRNCYIADFNNSGTVSVQDIFDFLDAYFSADPSADVNSSGTVTVQDIFDYLAAYFNPMCD